ncbi:MAG TPA: hypothetical protein VHZ95_06155, partial [Polyangiales bacterium]|nr:hypothetical protein [Polyangiales bacterium]
LTAQRALIGALYEQALELYSARLAGLNTKENLAGLTAAQIERSRLLLFYAVGALQAGLGIKGALEQAEHLDGLPDGQILAASVRENYSVRRGDTAGAQQWRRRRELLQIQQRRPHALKLRQATQQLECSAHADDLEETKRNLELLEELSSIYPSALPYVHFGRGEYERIRGHYAASLVHIHRALELAKPGVHPVWPWAAGCEIECLRQLKRLVAACRVGAKHVEAAGRAGMSVMRDHVETFLALAEGELGRFEIATERLDRGIAYRERFGMYGLNLGWSYEARAQLALWMSDQSTFEHCMRNCSDHYRGGRDSPALAARYEHLLKAGLTCWQGIDSVSLAVGADLTTIEQSGMIAPEDAVVLRTLIDCPDRDERARIVFERLLATANCQDGQLYLLREEGLSWAAGSAPSPELRSLMERVLGVDEDPDDRTVTGEGESLVGTAIALHDLRPVILTCLRGDEVATVGVVALRSEGPTRASQFLATARELSRVLIDLGDVKPKFG